MKINAGKDEFAVCNCGFILCRCFSTLNAKFIVCKAWKRSHAGFPFVA